MSYSSALTRIDQIESMFSTMHLGSGSYPGAGSNGFSTQLQTAVNNISGGPTPLNVPASSLQSAVYPNQAPSTTDPEAGAYTNRATGSLTNVDSAPTTGLTPATKSYFQRAAARYNVPVNLALAVGRAESGYRADAVSSSGAQGVMQLMPTTAAGLGVTNSFDPAQNIDAGVHYLGNLLQRFGGNQQLAVAAYNAGPNAVAKYGGVPPYTETQNYVQRVMGYAAQLGGSALTTGTAAMGSNYMAGSPV